MAKLALELVESKSGSKLEQSSFGPMTGPSDLIHLYNPAMNANDIEIINLFYSNSWGENAATPELNSIFVKNVKRRFYSH